MIGIPVFAGLPILYHLADFNINAECKWYKFLPGGTGDVIIPITFEVDDLQPEFVNEISFDDLPVDILNHSTIFTYEEAIEHIRFIKMNYSMGMYTSIYKPVFFFMAC